MVCPCQNRPSVFSGVSSNSFSSSSLDVIWPTSIEELGNVCNKHLGMNNITYTYPILHIVPENTYSYRRVFAFPFFKFFTELSIKCINDVHKLTLIFLYFKTLSWMLMSHCLFKIFFNSFLVLFVFIYFYFRPMQHLSLMICRSNIVLSVHLDLNTS